MFFDCVRRASAAGSRGREQEGGMIARKSAAVLLLLAAATPALAQEQPWTLVLKGTVTTSSQLFPDPNAPDPVARAQSVELAAAYGYGGELRYRFPETHLALGLSVEYLQARVDHPIFTRNDVIPVSDGYTVVPIELTCYFLIPFSGQTFSVYMGGGAGIYPGQREYSVADISSSSDGFTPGGGIHVLAGVSYQPIARLSVLGEMKFRDLQFKASNSFGSTPLVYHGTAIGGLVPREAEASIHTDGIIFQLGVAFSF
jgi:hypothetical protein